MGGKKALKKVANGAKRAGARVIKRAVRAAVDQAKSEALTALGPMRGPAVATFNGLKTVFGRGDYTNELVRGAGGPGRTFGKTGVRVRHREYVGAVRSTNAFAVTKYVVNPGDSLSFPWLSNLANAFSEWEPMGMIFEFVSSAGMTTAGSGALGIVCMAAQYNAFAADVITRAQLQNLPYATQCAPWENAACGIECLPKERATKKLFIRGNTSQPVGAAANLFDLCDFFVGTDGNASADTVLGDIWVTYDIILSMPEIPRTVMSPLYYQANFAAVAADAPFVIAAEDQIANTLGVVLGSSSTHLYIPPGSYENETYFLASVFVLDSAPITTGTWTWTVGSGATATDQNFCPIVGSTARNAYSQCLFKVTDWRLTLDIQLTNTISTTLTTINVHVQQVPFESLD